MEAQPKEPKRGMNLVRWVLLGLGIGLVASVILLFPFRSDCFKGPYADSRIRACQIAVACRDYVQAYGQWPTNTADAVEADANLVSTLVGKYPVTNPRNIVFFEVPPKLLNSRGSFIDQWKRPYWIRFDHDFDSIADFGAKLPGVSEISFH